MVWKASGTVQIAIIYLNNTFNYFNQGQNLIRYMKKFLNMKFIITGAASGMGAVEAKLFSKENAKIFRKRS